MVLAVWCADYYADYAGAMAQSRPALYAAVVTGLGFVALSIAAAAVGIPIWGYYEYLQGGWDGEHGYFGPWKVCKQLNYNREVCGDFRFRPSSKWSSVGGVGLIGI